MNVLSFDESAHLFSFSMSNIFKINFVAQKSSKANSVGSKGRCQGLLVSSWYIFEESIKSHSETMIDLMRKDEAEQPPCYKLCLFE